MINLTKHPFILIIVPNKIGILTYNLNLNTMNYKPYCYSFFVPTDKFTEFWGNDVVSFEKTDGGWIFWVLN